MKHEYRIRSKDSSFEAIGGDEHLDFLDKTLKRRLSLERIQKSSPTQ